MKIKKTKINGCYEILFRRNRDKRGFFLRSYCLNFLKLKKINFSIKQTNISYNKKKYTFRGYHYETKKFKENKIISALNGKALNITIDLRKNSKTYLKVQKKIIKSNTNSILVPAGCANAFLTLENNTVIFYLMSDFFDRRDVNRYAGFKFNDPFFKIKLPAKPLVISKKDLSFKPFNSKINDNR